MEAARAEEVEFGSRPLLMGAGSTGLVSARLNLAGRVQGDEQRKPAACRSGAVWGEMRFLEMGSVMVPVAGMRTGMRLLLPCGSRSPPVQQRALLCDALWDGDQVLQRPRSSLPYEEGAAPALEDCAGKEKLWSAGMCLVVCQSAGEGSSALRAGCNCSVLFSQVVRRSPRFHVIGEHWIVVSGA